MGLLENREVFVRAFTFRLRAARVAAQISQVRAAEAVGVSEMTIFNWEAARNNMGPRPFELLRLACLYRVSVDWLLTGRRLSHDMGAPPAEDDEPASGPQNSSSCLQDSAIRCPHLLPLTERCQACEG